MAFGHLKFLKDLEILSLGDCDEASGLVSDYSHT